MLEVIVSLVLVSTLLIVSMSSSANLIAWQNDRLLDPMSQRLAGYYLDELSMLPFEDPDGDARFGIESGENVGRAMDDVDDYHYWSQSPPTFRDGRAMERYDSWTVSITVSPAMLVDSLPFVTGDADDPLRLVEVTVRRTAEDLSRYRCLLSRDGQAIDSSQSRLRFQRLRLQFPDASSVDVVAPHRNRPTAF